MYVYIKSEPNLWTVGFYTPKGEWNPESDHSTKEEAANRVRYLNGGTLGARQLLERLISIIESDKVVADREAKMSVAAVDRRFGEGRAVAYGRVLSLLTLELKPSSERQYTKRR